MDTSSLESMFLHHSASRVSDLARNTVALQTIMLTSPREFRQTIGPTMYPQPLASSALMMIPQFGMFWNCNAIITVSVSRSQTWQIGHLPIPTSYQRTMLMIFHCASVTISTFQSSYGLIETWTTDKLSEISLFLASECRMTMTQQATRVLWMTM